MSSSQSHSPCAACKYLRRKCTPECVFAPYFPADQPQKFESVHKVYGASNVTKILSDLPVSQRAATVRSLTYEAESRLRDPIYGCVRLISILQQRLKQVHEDVYKAKHELSSYIGPNGLQMYQEMGQRQQQMVEEQQLAAVFAANEQHNQWQMMLGNMHKKHESPEQHMLNQQQHQLNQQRELMQQHEFGAAGFNVGGSASLSDPTVSGMGVGFEDHNQYPFIPQQEQNDHVQIQTQHLFQTRDDNEIQLRHQSHLNHHQQQQQHERSDLTAVIEMGVGFEDNQFEFIQHKQEQHGDDHEQQQQVVQTQHLFQTIDDYNEIQLQNQPHLKHHQQQQQQQEGPGSDGPVS